ncbi:MAG: hypothetical protein JWN68_2393 [Nocardioides sp.]|jgi:hypothetical protein|uniref:hypothetical protein n=1 Tax=Nocardioides sp. TaxID=35761 RepID=UPI00260425D7|nr:hypothetical protein [Nocardioides sp.]MCW2834440.1 hypothetical protein [Nocardioides sp.]
MKPLASIAMGLVIVVLVARFDGYDALPDPLGWLLVLWGVRRLLDPTPLLTLAGAALVVACVVWFPATQEALDRSEPSLRWAVNLPQVLFCVVLCHRLAALAQAARDAKAAAWLRTTMVLNAVLAAAPVLAFALGSDDLLPAIYAGAAAVVLLLIVLLFAHADRRWAPDAAPVRPA